MRTNIVKLLFCSMVVGLFILPMTGCAQKTVKVTPAEETAQVEKPAAQPQATTPEATGQMESTPMNEGAGPNESLESKPATPAGANVGTVENSRTSVGFLPVYFDFDKSLVRPDQVQRMEANAAYLKSNPNVKIQIQGNCDERGTNEYNMALGERPAMSAKKYLVNLGIEANRLNTISFGEERPINPGHNEAAWSENRRDDFAIE